MRTLFLLLIIGMSLPCGAQRATNGKAISAGPCSPAISGNGNTFNIRCEINSGQGKTMVALLNKILANQMDTAIVMAKLDEILAASKSGRSQTCVGSNCVQGNNYGNQVYNQYGARKLLLTDEQSAAIRDRMQAYKGASVEISINVSEQDSELFGERLAASLQSSGMNVAVKSAYSMVNMGSPSSGIAFAYSIDRSDAAEALAKEFVDLGITTAPIPGHLTPDRQGVFTVIVQPNR